MTADDLQRIPLLGSEDIDHKIRRMASEIIEQHAGQPLAFVGIHTRGVVLADRIYQQLAGDCPGIERGTLDISLYRDDLDNLGAIPSIQGSDIPFQVEGATVLLFDDVLFTGRTIRAAIDELIDYGRPARIQLAVLVDRGNRELPIAPDFTGHPLQTSRDDYIAVRFRETDGEDGVFQFVGEVPK